MKPRIAPPNTKIKTKISGLMRRDGPKLSAASHEAACESRLGPLSQRVVSRSAPQMAQPARRTERPALYSLDNGCGQACLTQT